MVESHSRGGATLESITGYNKDSLLECHICGRTDFKNAQAIGVHMGRSHDGEPWTPKELLEKLYVEKEMGTREIASLIGCGKKAILRHLRRHGVEVDKCIRDGGYVPWHGFTTSREKVGSQYEVVIIQEDYEQHTVPIHRLVAVATGELDPSDWANDNIEVHHQTEHGLDNRPDKLKALTIKEHRQYHLGKSK